MQAPSFDVSTFVSVRTEQPDIDLANFILRVETNQNHSCEYFYIFIFGGEEGCSKNRVDFENGLSLSNGSEPKTWF